MNVIAVDVGTTSVRLAIISFGGDAARKAAVIASHKKEISHNQDGKKFEQSSSQIWQAVCQCSKICIEKSGINPESVKSIAFSATCSLVIVGAEPCINGDDIIMWMDHRAVTEAQMITASGSKVLSQFGGVCSPEFSLAKLLWIKRNRSDIFDAATGFFELPDWLVYKCIGGSIASCPRSLCCLTCKWGYDADINSHCDMICDLDLKKIIDKIGLKVLKPGQIAGFLSKSAAGELGLLGSHFQDKENLNPSNIVVGTSLIDAHAGLLAMLSFPIDYSGAGRKIQSTFCSLAGTSSCHMLLSKLKSFTPGIWGPYRDVVIDGYYLLEAGQSLTGKLIEICIENHVDGRERLQSGQTMYEIIESLNQQLRGKKSTCDLHMLPTFHGNRSPLANPRLRGGVYGLSAEGPKSLLEYYEATVTSLAYETKFIIATLGTKLDAVLVSGGLMKNNFFMQTLADVLQCQTVRVSLKEIDFMVMGSGLVARHAALSKIDLPEPAQATTHSIIRESIANIEYDQIEFKIYHPDMNKVKYHEKRFLCYKEFVEFSERVDAIMKI